MDKVTISLGRDERLELYSVRDFFDVGIAMLHQEGLELITTRELLEARMAAGPEAAINKRGVWVAESYAYFPRGDILIADRAHNPLLKNAREATAAHRRGEEFYLDDATVREFLRLAETDPTKAIQSGVLRVPRAALRKELPASAWREEAVPIFLFRDKARAYGGFMRKNGLEEVPHTIIHYAADAAYVDAQRQPFARSLLIDQLSTHFDLGSHLHTKERQLDRNGYIYGMRRAGK